MKRHTQFTGIRNWYGGDLIDLQAEPLKILDGFFSEFGSFILSGCRITPNGAAYNVSSGIVALQGKGPNGEDVKVVAPFEGATGVALPLYLTLQCETLKATYVDGNLQPIAYIYKAIGSSIKPGVSYVEVSATSNIRFNDVLQDATHRLLTDAERTLWNGKETATGAQAKADAALAKAKTYADGKETPTGAQAKADAALAKAKTYTDNAVADLVASSPAALDTLKELAAALGNDPNFATTVLNKIATKVDKIHGKGLSTNDYTSTDKTKVDHAYTFDYIVDSDAALAGIATASGCTSVLIKRGTWSFTSFDGYGIWIPESVKHIVGEADSELTFRNVSRGTCFGYSDMRIENDCKVENVTVRNLSQNATVTSCFRGMKNLYRCIGYMGKNAVAPIFDYCTYMYGCRAENQDAGNCASGFASCHYLTDCLAVGNILIGYINCENMTQCNAQTTKASFAKGCGEMLLCSGNGTMSSCFGVSRCEASQYVNSYFSNEAMTGHQCANSLNGGWNTLYI